MSRLAVFGMVASCALSAIAVPASARAPEGHALSATAAPPLPTPTPTFDGSSGPYTVGVLPLTTIAANTACGGGGKENAIALIIGLLLLEGLRRLTSNPPKS